jgi:hypothetical protein
VLNLGELDGNDIAVEVIFIRRHKSDEVTEVISKDTLALKEFKDSRATYKGIINTTRSGVYEYSFRIYPKSDLLVNRMEMPYIKWI